MAFDRRVLRVIEGGAQPAPEDPVTPSDLAMIAAIGRGNTSAAAAFHDRLRPVVDRTLRRLIGGHDADYDDIAQQALIELVISAGRFRAECPLEAWASTVTARAAYKHLRRRRIERRLFVLDAREFLELPDRAAGVPLLRSTIRRIDQHLRQIDPEKAWAFLLHDVHGYDLEEISAITGASKPAVQSRLVRGRRALHRRLEEDPELVALLSDIRSQPENG